MSRGRRCVAPAAGNHPRRASPKPNCAGSAATRMSHHSACSSPLLLAWPLTAAMSGSPALALERLDQLRERAVRVLAATKLAPGLGAKTNEHRLGDELTASRLEPLRLLVEVFSEQRYPGNAGVVQVGIGRACGLGL